MDTSNRSTHRRKPPTTMKVKFDFARPKQRAEGEESDNASTASSKNSAPNTRDNSVDRSDDEIPDHLPEGTVVVRPEPVKEKRPRFHGPEFSKSKKDGVALEELNKVNCTACGRQINPQITSAAKKHPVLKVLICRKCYKYYQSGEIGQDEDGLDEQCRWCGDGGKLNGCDYCHNAFCKSCVLRNFGRSELSVVTDADKKWKCYVCDPGNLAKLQVECDTVLQAVELARIAAGCSSAKSNGFKSSADSGRKASDKPLTDIVSTLTFNHEDIGKKLTRLQTATQTFAMVLETLTAKLKPSAQEEDTDELSQEDTDGLSQEDKEKKCMRFVEKGLRTYMTSIQSILIPPTSVEPASASSSQPNGTGKEKAEPPKTQKRTGIPPKKKSGGKDAEESNSDKSEESDGAGADDTDNSVVAPTPKAAASKKKKASADCDDSPRRKPAVQRADKPRENKGSDEDEEATAENPAAGPESPMEEEAKELTAKNGAEKEASVADEGGSKDEMDNSINIDNEVAHLQLLEEMAQEIGHDLDDKCDESEMSAALKKGNDEKSDCQDDALLSEEVENKVEKKSLDEDEEDMEVDDTNKDEEGEEDKDEDEEGSDTKKADKPKKKSKGLAGSSSKNSPSPKKSKHSKSEDKDNSDEDSDSDDSPSQKKSSKSDKAKAGKGRDEGKKDGKTKGAKTEKGKKASKSSIVDEDSISSSDLIMSDDDDWKERATQSKKGGRRRRTAAARSRKEDSESSSSEEDDKKEKKSRKSKKSEAEKEDSKKEDSKKGSSKKESSKKDSPKKEGAKKEGSKKEGSKKEASKKDGSEKEETKPRRRRGKGSHSSDDEEDEDAKLDREIAALEKKPQLRKEKMPASSDDDEEEDENESGGEEEKDASAEKAKKRKKGSDDETQKKKRRKKASSGSESDDEDEEDDEDDEEDNEDEEEIAKAKKLVGGDDTMEGSDVDRKARASGDDKEEEEDEEDNDDDKSSDDSDDLEDTKKKRAKKDKSTKEDGKEKSDDEERAKDEDDKEAENDEDMEVEDEDGLDNRTKQFRNSLLDAKLSESDSDIEVKPKVKGRGKKRKKGSDEESFKASSDSDDEEDNEDDDDDDESDDKSNSESDDDDDDSDSKKKKKKGKKGKKGKGKGKGKKGKKRRRIRNNSDSDDSGSDNDEQKEGKGRKKIRNIISDKKLKDTTKAAAKAEQERRKRVEELQKQFNVVTVTDDKAPNACPVTTQLVLEVDPETKEPIIEVNKKLIKKLKPHQVEAVQFLWSSCIESLKRCKKEEGSGCLLAHCMGLGKTLSVVTFVHTLLANAKKTRIHTALIVCPLNTVLNWQNELHMWLSSKDQLDVWELTNVKNNMARAEKLKEWHTEGGVMIMGYEMYRNLSRGANCKSKRHKAIFRETLVDPGPDVVVCDEGHILKNDASALSKAMNEMKTRRRIVLTGTPLQNNLSEYHCMVNFIKPDLLGTRKEFLNRFVNPITNGQHSDATPSDVKLMKKRAHVLHEMLAGCVQRKDYSALTRFLPPKFEYVMSVRLSTIQMKLYEMYLQNRGINNMGEGELTVKGGKLFSDYQFLMRVWTHPWVLKLAEIRQDQKVKYDDYDDEDEELNDSFIDDNTSDEESEAKSTSSGRGDSDVIAMDSGEEAAPSTSRGTRRTRAQAKAERKDDNEDEIVKKWNTRSRRGEEPKSESEEEVEEENKEVSSEWWAEFVKQEDAFKMELSGKLMLLFEVLSRCEEIGDKVLVFSQSLLSLDIIEDFLATVDRKFQEETSNKEDEDGDNSKFVFGKTWTKGADYFRMDGSTGAQLRQSWAEHFNDPENYRSRLFLISTKAGSLGINLVAANRVIIFDASWNPSHDIQSIFRVYRFGQEKPCYIYRFLAQGTMEEKIYLRQVTKQSLSQRVVDEHQIERHFTQSDLQDLYRFQPDRLDDPDRVEQVFSLPKDTLLAELLKSHKDWIVTYHEHDSLLENQVDQNLTEEEKKSAWDEYENEKKGLYNRVQHPNMYQGQPMGGNPHLYNMLSSMRPEHVQHIAQTIRAQYPHLSPEEYEQHVHQALMQQLRFQDMFQKQLYEQRQQQEYQRLREIQQQIQQQQQQQQRLQQQRLHQQQQIQQQQMQQQQMQVAGGYAPGSVMHRLMGGTGAGSMPEMNQGLAGLRNSLQSTMQKDGKSTDGASGGSSKEGQPSSSK